jgi:hypothetical protein
VVGFIPFDQYVPDRRNCVRHINLVEIVDRFYLIRVASGFT